MTHTFDSAVAAAAKQAFNTLAAYVVFIDSNGKLQTCRAGMYVNSANETVILTVTPGRTD